MADVQLIRWSLFAAAALKAVGDTVLLDGPALLAVGWMAAAIAVAANVRWGAAAVAAVAFMSMGWTPTAHTAFIGWVGTCLAVAGPQHLASTLRVLLLTVYTFAVANKIVGGVFLTGLPIMQMTGWPRHIAVVAAIGALAGQMWMVWALGRRDWTALPVAAAMHVGITIGMAAETGVLIPLLVFNGLTVAAVWVCQGMPTSWRQMSHDPA